MEEVPMSYGWLFIAFFVFSVLSLTAFHQNKLNEPHAQQVAIDEPTPP
jgi:hypothetical protein